MGRGGSHVAVTMFLGREAREFFEGQSWGKAAYVVLWDKEQMWGAGPEAMSGDGWDKEEG